MRWTGHIAHMGDLINACKILVIICEGRDIDINGG
jgi:hypothetical protein